MTNALFDEPYSEYQIQIGDAEASVVVSSDCECHADVFDHVEAYSDFNEHTLDTVIAFSRGYCQRISALTKVFVPMESRGQGLGAQLVRQYLSDMGEGTDMDLLFATVTREQESGIDLVSFYSKLGFEAVEESDGRLLMVNKGMAQALKSLLSAVSAEESQMDLGPGA